MLVASLADLHARGKDLKAFRRQLSAAVATIIARKADLTLFAGDIFDRETIGDQHARTGAIAKAVIDPIYTLADYCPILMLPGNHDVAGVGSMDALTVFESQERPLQSNPARVNEAPKITVVRSAGWYHRDSLDIYCLPWSWSHGSAQATWEATVGNCAHKKTAFLAHVQVIGSKMSAKRVCDGGSWCVSREFLQSLPFDRFILGDFHERQPDLIPGRGGYVGALRQLGFGEAHNPQGMEFWDTETGEVEWVELNEAPRYRTVHISEGEPFPEQGDNEHLRVVADGFIPDRALAAKLEAAGGKVEYDLPKVERVRRMEAIPEGRLGDMPELLRQYGQTREPKIEGEEMEALEAELVGVMGDTTEKEGEAA